jgi:hypothetical protein
MDNDRTFGGRLKDEKAYPFAAVVVLSLAILIGIGLVEGGDVAVIPAAESMAGPSLSPSPSQTARPSVKVAARPTLAPSGFEGLVALPPADAVPSMPEAGKLIESHWVDGGGLPYRGMARLYADGRLIWNRYYSDPEGLNSRTTGYLEQRLTPEGVSLVQAEKYLPKKDPLELLNRLPLDTWEVRWPVAYVPSGYGICLHTHDPRPGSMNDVVLDPELAIALLPSSISRLLADDGYVMPVDWDENCIEQTTEEARALERALRNADAHQDTFTKRFMVQYAVPMPGESDQEIWLRFEPAFPDGSIGCSACG